MKFNGILGRIVLALLVGLITFIVVFILGVIIGKFDAQIGDVIQKFSPLIGLLAGLVKFFTGESPLV